MSELSLEQSFGRAQERLHRRTPAIRSDRGTSRLAAQVEGRIAQLLGGQDRPSMTEVHRKLDTFCVRRGLKTPSRASLYNAVGRVPVPQVRWTELSEAARHSLYNRIQPEDAAAAMPGDEVVFYVFNYGRADAFGFAARLPWLCLVRAEQRTGWRPKSRGLLRAVMRYRGLV